jgi:hypothetical protein
MTNRETTLVRDRAGTADLQIQRLAEEIYRERVAEASMLPPEEKLLAGEELFDYACSITLVGIRDQSPGLSDEECLRILEERLDLRERMEQQR